MGGVQSELIAQADHPDRKEEVKARAKEYRTEQKHSLILLEQHRVPPLEQQQGQAAAHAAQDPAVYHRLLGDFYGLHGGRIHNGRIVSNDNDAAAGDGAVRGWVNAQLTPQVRAVLSESGLSELVGGIEQGIIKWCRQFDA